MARYYGRIGFLQAEEESEESPSRYIPKIVERMYVGDLYKNGMRQQSAEKPIDNFGINNDISIVADAYALNNFSSMKYVEFMGTLWEVQSVTVEHPRLRISFGGVYHGPVPEKRCCSSC